MEFRPFRTLFLAGLFALASGAGTALAADSRPCDDPTAKNAEDILVTQCVSQCNQAFKNTSEKMTERIAERCGKAMRDQSKRNAFEGGSPLTRENFEWFAMKCLPRAGYKLVTDPFVLAGHLMSMAGENAYKHRMPAGFEGGIRQCEKSADCRRSFARNLIAYQKRTPAGEWIVPDAEVDKAIRGRPLTELIQVGDQQRDASKRECERELGEVRKGVRRELAGEDWDGKADRKVYDTLGTSDPHCLGLLKLYPPELKIRSDATGGAGDKTAAKPTPEAKDKAPILNESLRRQLLLGDICVGQADEERIKNNAVDDEYTTEFCGEMTSLLAPVGVVAKAARTAAPVRAASSEAKAAAAEARAGGAAANAERIPMGEAGPVGTSAARAEASVAKTARQDARDTLVRSHESRVFATEAQNLAYMKRAEAPPSPGTWFVDREISVLKQLNNTGDKSLATALTNLDKDIFLKNLESLKAKYPGVTIETYSDYKSVKLAITEGGGFTSAQREAFKKDLDAIVRKSGKEYGDEVRRLGLDVGEAGPPEKWIKTAADDTFEGAADRVRHARGENDAGLFTRDIRAERNAQLSQLETERAALADSPRFRELMDRADPSASVPKAEVFDLTRKYSTPDSLAQAVRDRYGVEDFTSADARRLMKYSEGVNGFTPTLLVPKREVVSLEGATNGGMTADFLGLGSANLHATARGVAGKTEIAGALRGARQGERDVTEAFRRKMDKFKSIAGKDSVCTGDDCARIASTALSTSEKARIVEKMAKDPDTRRIRMAFFGPEVPASARMQIASHGEMIEKALRKELTGKIPAGKLDSMVFGLDMKGAKLNTGDVNLIIGRSGAAARLTDSERRAIQDAFSKAIDRYNAGVARYQTGGTTTTERTLYLIPNPSLFDAD